MDKNFRYLVYSVVLTVAGYGVWIGLQDHEHILQAIDEIGLLGFAWLCLFSLANYGLRYLRWMFLLRHLGDRMPHKDGLICYISGFALTTTPAKAGEAIRCLYFYRRHNINYGHTLAGIFTERTTDAVASMFIAGMALFSFQEMRWVGFAFTLFILAVVFFVSQPQLLIKVSGLLRFIKLSLVQKLLELIPVFLERSATLFSPRPFGGGVLIGLIAWSCEAYAFAWLAHALGGEASTMLYMSIFAIAMVAGALTFMPGGLGGAEAVLFLLLKTTGMGDSEAVTATLLCRLATLWFAVVLGLGSVLWLETHPHGDQSMWRINGPR